MQDYSFTRDWFGCEAFRKAFNREPEVIAHAGGRVNIIGEHTDYHEGFVFPAAIHLRTFAVGAKREDLEVNIFSKNFGQFARGHIDRLTPGNLSWSSYALGPFFALREHGYQICGADVWIWGEVPLGGGLSSSASIEVALVMLAAHLAGVKLEPMEAAKIAKFAENHFCGVPCGVMDQLASSCGEMGHALLIDCRTLHTRTVAFPSSWALVVADSGVKHSVASHEYAKRQIECAEGMEVVRAVYPDVRTARDLDLGRLEELRHKMNEVAYRRLRHVVTENARTLEAAEAMERGDADLMGKLLYDSHESLKNDYEVSCAELDLLVEKASAISGVIGARLTGAGFGGNTVNVVQAYRAQDFCLELAEAYERATGKYNIVRTVIPSEGVVVQTL